MILKRLPWTDKEDCIPVSAHEDKASSSWGLDIIKDFLLLSVHV